MLALLASIIIYAYILSGIRTKPIKLRLIPRNSTERCPPKPSPQPVHYGQTLQPTVSSMQYPKSPCSPNLGSFLSDKSQSQRRGSSPQTSPQTMAGCTTLRINHSAQNSPLGPRSPRFGVIGDPWYNSNLKDRRSSGEMEWLTAPGPSISRKNSWSSVSTEFDLSPCW